MSIGIMDADLATYILVPFNLEVMKLSAYYKKKREIVVLSPSFTPNKNTKFFYRKDYNDGDFPVGLTKAQNVEYGGLAFSNNIYKPLPIEIEVGDGGRADREREAFLASPGLGPKTRGLASPHQGSVAVGQTDQRAGSPGREVGTGWP